MCQGSWLLEEVACARHDLELGRASQVAERFAVKAEDVDIVPSDDEQGGGVDEWQPVASQVWTSPAGDDAADEIRAPSRHGERCSRPSARPEERDTEMLGPWRGDRPCDGALKAVGKVLDVEDMRSDRRLVFGEEIE